MRTALLTLAVLALNATPVAAQTADDIIARYVARVGGADRIQAATSIRRTGKFIGGGDDTAAAHSKGELKAKLEAAGAL